MILIKLLVLIIGFIAGQYETTHAELLTALENNGNVSIVVKSKDNKTVIELNKDITVNTDLNLDKTLAQLNGTEASYIPKIRKVTPVDNDSLDITGIKASENNSTIANVTITTTKTQASSQVTKNLSDGGGVVVGLTVPAKNNFKMKEDAVIKENTTEKSVSESTSSFSNDVNKIDEKVKVNLKNVIEIPNQSSNTNNKNINITTTTIAPITTATSVVSLTTAPLTNNVTKALNATTKATVSIENNAVTTKTTSTTNTTTTATTTTTTHTTTFTTTTTTPKPKKPTITYSIPDFPDLEKDNPELNSLLQSSASSSDGPYAQPSQEYTSNSFQRGRDFILPIVSMIFIIPLVIGIMITSYRRFRDCWSTRHYRRMDFLVDGMYND